MRKSLFSLTIAVGLLGAASAFAYGGNGGGPYDDKPASVAGPITTLFIRSGNYLDNIQITYGTKPGPAHGANGGSPNQIQLQSGEYIVKIFGRSGNYVDQINFVTNKGRSFGPYGGPGGAPFLEAAPAGKALVSINGRSGSYVDQINLVWGPAPAAAPAPVTTPATTPAKPVTPTTPAPTTPAKPK